MLQFSKQKQQHADYGMRLMETETIQKNGASLKSRMSRGNMISKVLCSAMLAMTIISFTSCEKEKHDDDAPPLPAYIALDQNLGDQIDYAILGLDGSGYFYEFQDENPNIPQRLSINNGNKENVDLVINFDEDGLPKNILSENFAVVLGKYEGSKFNAVIVTKDGESQIFENIETDVSWDEYKNAISKTNARVHAQMLRSVSSDPLEWVNWAVGGIGCGLSSAAVITAPIFAPFTAALAAISCTNWIYNTDNIFGLDLLPDFKPGSDLGYYAGLYKCIASIAKPELAWSCVSSVTSTAVRLSDWIANNLKTEIKLGEEILYPLTITSPSCGTTYYCGEWIDIFVSGYTGADWQDYLELQYWCLAGEPQPSNANEPSTYTNKAYPRKEAAYSFSFSPETPSVWEGHWVKLVAINKKSNTRSAPQYIRIAPAADIFPFVGLWILTGKDTSPWTADLVIEETNNNDFYGYFDWYRSGTDYAGREYFQGVYKPSDRTIVLNGYKLVDPQNIILGTYKAIVADSYDFVSGTWGGGWGAYGTWHAEWKR